MSCLTAIPWTAACQVSLTFITSPSLLRHVYWVSEAIQPSHPLWLPSLSLSLSQCQRVFLMCQLFASGGQSIGASASILPMNIQGWSPLGLTDLILLSKGLSRVFSSSTTDWKHQFFGTQPSLWSNSHPCMTIEKTIALTIQTFVCKVISAF